jgi:hypothetical protein
MYVISIMMLTLLLFQTNQRCSFILVNATEEAAHKFLFNVHTLEHEYFTLLNGTDFNSAHRKFIQ